MVKVKGMQTIKKVVAICFEPVTKGLLDHNYLATSIYTNSICFIILPIGKIIHFLC
jgi:hypothetical protein